MPISQSDQVFTLVKSLTSAEKRNFRSYAKRIQDNSELLFLQLFDIMDKQKELDDHYVLLQMGNPGSSKYANLKRHLFSQIIASLRMLHREKSANYQVREYLDYAYILYGKGLYLQALKILKKGRRLANKHHLIYMELSIIEFEKTIETRHITRSGSSRAEALIEESNLIQEGANYLVRLSNLRIRMHAKYLQNGHVRNREEAEEIRAYYRAQIGSINLEKLGLVERVFYLQAGVWYHYILLDFNGCLDYAQQWVQLFEDHPTLVERDVDLYMRGFHYVLTATYHTKNAAAHSVYLAKFEAFRRRSYGKFNTNSQIRSFLYVHTGRLDNLILRGAFDLADRVIPKVLNRIKRYHYKLDDHRIMVFYYKFAWIYLGAGEIDKSINYLNQIINNELNKLREDLQQYARILRLICHYELGNVDVLDYSLTTYSSYFNRKKEVNSFLKLAMDLFAALKSNSPLEHKAILGKYKERFETLSQDPYERRALDYLDINSWLESKLVGKRMGEIIREKYG